MSDYVADLIHTLARALPADDNNAHRVLDRLGQELERLRLRSEPMGKSKKHKKTLIVVPHANQSPAAYEERIETYLVKLLASLLADTPITVPMLNRVIAEMDGPRAGDQWDVLTATARLILRYNDALNTLLRGCKSLDVPIGEGEEG